MSTYPNYVRTLLLNQASGYADTLAEEYVSPDFLPRELPAAFTKIRSVLFGGTPDRQMLNFRLYQLMQVLHATELVEYVTQDDARITYLPFDRDELFYDAFVADVSATSGTTGTLNVLGTLAPDEANGIIYHKWRVLVNFGNTVTVTEIAPDSQQEVLTYALTNGLSNAISLVGSNLQFNFSGNPDDSWYIEVVARPSQNMADILATLKDVVSSADEQVLFGQSPAEPYLTFKNLWQRHEQYAYQLGGLLLAMAFQTRNLSPA